MGAGNILALKKTLDSFKGIVDEVVYGDMLLFSEDRLILDSYKEKYNINIQRLPFNYIFQMGFSSLLNFLISNAKNDVCIYMNTGEAIEENYGINEIVDNNPECNSFFFTHKTDKHRWHRTNDRKDLMWQGFIHEECTFGEVKPYHKPIFQMQDFEKDMADIWKASVFNLVKNIVYFEQYRKIEANPKLLKGTNEGWLNWVKEQQPSMTDRLNGFGVFYQAFQVGNYEMFMKALEDYDTSDFDFTSSKLVNFQGKRLDIL